MLTHLCCTWLSAQSEPLPALRVLVAGSEPFVSTTATEPEGLSIDVWQAVNDTLGFQVELEPVDAVDTVIDMIAAREADLGVGPISITPERAEQVRFTQPYFHSNLGILAPVRGTLYNRFAPFLTTTFITGASALLGVLLLVGTLLWVAERQANPEHFPARGLSGIGNGIWMALVTMTTVGYGDRVPQTMAGRIITGAWMLASLVIASSLTAFLATALTLSQMDEPAIGTIRDLVGRRVSVVEGTTSEQFVMESGARALAAPTLEDALADVREGNTVALVFDRPILRYLLNQRPELDFELSPATYQPQNYGFVTPMDSELADALSLEILRLQESGDLVRIEERWLGQ